MELVDQLTREITKSYPKINPEKLNIIIGKTLSHYRVSLIPVTPQHPDIDEKVSLFIGAKKLEGLSKLTLRGYRTELRIFGNIVQKPVADIQLNDIRLFLNQFSHLKMSSLSRKLSVVKSFFKWMTEEELVNKNPTLKMKLPKRQKPLPKALNVDELEMLRESCKTSRERALVELLYATGCRLSEIQQLNKDDIDWKNRSIKVLGKGNKEREVLFGWKANYYLEKYLGERVDQESALFVTQRTPVKRMSKRTIQREIKVIAKRGGLKKNVHPHVYRHTFATLALNNGMDLSVVQAMLGHSNPSTTQVYAQITDERRREQYRRYVVQ